MKKLKSTDEILDESFWTDEWDGTGDEIANLLTQDRNQAYTSLVEGIDGMKSDPTLPVDDALYSRSDIDREVDKTLTDILEKVVKPLYGKKALDNTPPNKV